MRFDLRRYGVVKSASGGDDWLFLGELAISGTEGDSVLFDCCGPGVFAISNSLFPVLCFVELLDVGSGVSTLHRSR